MGRVYGQTSRLLLNHDTVYLAEVLGGVKDWGEAFRSFHCFALPDSADEAPDVLRYAAAATVALAEYKLRDQCEDSKWFGWRWVRRFWNPRFRIAVRELNRLGFDVEALDLALSRQRAAERAPTSLEQLADPTATAVSMFFAHGRPELGEFGRRLGFLVYVLDAVEDFDRDAASGQFNALGALGLTRAEGIAAIDAAAAEAIAMLREVDPVLGVSFASRLRANLDPRLGRALPVVNACAQGPKRFTWSQAWDRAEELAEGRAWLVVAAVALNLFVFPAYGRIAEDADQCLSLSANLMAMSSLFAMSLTRRNKVRDCCGDCCAEGCIQGAGECCGECCCDCTCDGCH